MKGGALIEGASAASNIIMGTFGRTKSLISTNQAFTTGNMVAVGEELTYQLTIEVPQGETSDVAVVDTMTWGLSFLECQSITNDDPTELATTLAGGLNAACNDPTNPTVSSDGRIATFDLGDITNTNTDDGTVETITITYKAIVDNYQDVVNGMTLNNSAVVRWEGNNSAASASAPVVVREPRLQISANKTPSGSLNVGDVVSIVLDVSHANQSTMDAFDAYVEQSLPAGLELLPGTLDCSTGVISATSCSVVGNGVRAGWNTFTLGDTGKVKFDAVVTEAAFGQNLAMTATTGWTSLPGDVTVPQSTYSLISTERTSNTANPGGVSNAYRAVANSNVTVIGDSDDSSGGGVANSDNADGDDLASTGTNWWSLFIGGGLFVTVASITLGVLIGRKKTSLYKQ